MVVQYSFLQPQPPATLLAGDAEGLGSGEAEDMRPQLSCHMQPEALSLRAEGEVSEEIEATPHAASNPDCEEVRNILLFLLPKSDIEFHLIESQI